MSPSTKSFFHNFYCRRRLRRRTSVKTIKSILMCVSVGSLFVIILILYNDSVEQSGKVTIDLSNNYLQVADKFSHGVFLVDTTKCRIPDMDIWDVGIRPFVKPPLKFNCAETYLSLTHVVGDTVVINETALRLVGYTVDQITCCYQIVERVNQNRESYNMSADNLFRYSEECYQMEVITKPKASFIKVTCKVKGFFEGFFTYSHFHMVALLPPYLYSDESNRNITKKLSWWKDCLSKNGNANMGNRTELCQKFRDYGRPPNILMIGWDSSSRSNFHRFMHRTVDILENIIKPVEMVGYNKVGENTFPNFVPLMSSLSVAELVKECFSNSSVFQDDCPYIWKKFDELNYLTAHLEDAPKIAIFDYFKTGFLKPPVDIYSRPFMLAAYEEKGGGDELIECIGYQRPEEIILNYIVDLATLAETEQIPYFLTTWLTDLTHSDMNNLQLADALMAKSLLRLYEKGLLENTVLYLMSDHGYRFLEVRSTTSGWFEDKLPALWIKLPQTVIKVHPSWVDSLHENSRQLVTPFDVHQSFRHILTAYSSPAVKESLTESIFTSIRGQSLFSSKVPTRSCKESEIPVEYCACIPPTGCTFNSVMIKLAAEKIVESINADLPSECTQLSVGTVTACGMLKERTTSDLKNEVIQANTNVTSESYYTDEVVVVTLLTSPGNFLFEGMINFNKSTQQFGKVFKLIRMNKKNTSTSCLFKADSWIELVCYCDTLSIWNTFLQKIFLRSV